MATYASPIDESKYTCIYQYHNLELFYILIQHKVDFILKIATYQTHCFGCLSFEVEHIERKQNSLVWKNQYYLGRDIVAILEKYTPVYSLPRAKCFTRKTCEVNGTRGKAYKFYAIFIY